MIAFRAMDQLDWEWMKVHAKPIRCEDTQGMVAYDTETGKILACCACDSFTKTSCATHMAIVDPMVLRHGFLEAIAHHLFVTCNRSNVIGLVPSINAQALRFNEHIGFKEIARIPDGLDEGVDYVIMQMKREDCKWLEVSDGTKHAMDG